MAKTVKASKEGLNKIDRARLKKKWNKSESAWYDFAHTSASTLKRFLAGKRIDADVFERLCKAVGIEDWEAIADWEESSDEKESLAIASPPPAVYEKETWVERSGITESLLEILQGSCRVLAISGITGIGKTALVERLVSDIEDDKQMCRLNLDDGGLTGDFLSSGVAFLQYLGVKPTLEDQKDARILLQHLLRLLREKPYRICIESFENLLEGDDCEGWSNFKDSLWCDFFQQILVDDRCQSQLILTTQEIPAEWQTIGDRYSQFWHDELLQGLNEAEQLEFFQKSGLPLDSESQDYLQRIGKLYEGHPLVLRVIAQDIKVCHNDVIRYWQQCQFAELEQQNPVGFSRRKLKLQVKKRVQISLERLPEDAYQLLCRASVYRRPVPAFFWFALLPERTEEQHELALNLLKSRFLVEEDWQPNSWLGADGSIPLHQHNLIRNIAYELLKENRSVWENAENKAVKQWLTVYKPTPDISNLDKVRGYLEAFYHYCELKDWKKAIDILSIQNKNLDNRKLYQRLGDWGYYRERHNLYQCLWRGDLGDYSRIVLVYYMSNNFVCLEKYDYAIEGFQSCLKSARYNREKIEDDSFLKKIDVLEMNSLCGLASVSNHYNHSEEAIKYTEQCLSLNNLYKNLELQHQALGYLGNAYQDLGDYEKATQYLKQSLEISQKLQDKLAEATYLCNLARILLVTGSYDKAIQNVTEGILIYRSFQNLEGEANAIGILAAILSEQELQTAIQHWNNILLTYHKLGQYQKEKNILQNLAYAYEKLGREHISCKNYDKANEYLEKALERYKKLDLIFEQGDTLLDLGVVYMIQGKSENEIQCLEEALIIFEELENFSERGVVLNRLGMAYAKQGMLKQAINFWIKAAEIYQQLKQDNELAYIFNNLGTSYLFSGSIRNAIWCYKMYFDLANNIKNHLFIEKSSNNLKAIQNILDSGQNKMK